MIHRKLDVQFEPAPWISLGFHFDHTDPSLTLHLPFIIVCFGNVKQDGFTWSFRRWLKYGDWKRKPLEGETMVAIITAVLKRKAKRMGGEVEIRYLGVGSFGADFAYLGIMKDGKLHERDRYIVALEGWAYCDGYPVTREGTDLVTDLTVDPWFELYEKFSPIFETGDFKYESPYFSS